MARYTGPKNRLSRRENIDLGLKTAGSKSHASLLRRIKIIPGVHGQKGRRKISDYGLQLREKQKVKRLYGLLEKQFRKTFSIAKKWKGNTGDKFIEFLERRLDNVVYRLGFAPTRNCARQIINHGHITVDNHKVNIPSFLVSENNLISLKPKAMEIPAVKKMLDDKSFTLASWLQRKGSIGKVVRLPARSDVIDDINEQLIIEFYSR